jgi:hypothetical protein
VKNYYNFRLHIKQAAKRNALPTRQHFLSTRNPGTVVIDSQEGDSVILGAAFYPKDLTKIHQ